jgi:hypothetical protein
MVTVRVKPELRRSLYLIDIENLCATSSPSVAEVRSAWITLGRLVPAQPDDLVVVGVSSGSTALRVGEAFATTSVRYERGAHGADRALLGWGCPEFVSRRCDRVVLASGDGIFSDFIARVAGHGTLTLVVARPRCLARRLQLAANDVVYFRGTDPITPCSAEGASDAA